jgi:uroporphyrin-3 C-methyltransferase
MNEQTPASEPTSSQPTVAPATASASSAKPAVQTASGNKSVFPVVLSVAALLVSGWVWWQGQQDDPALASMNAAVATQDITLNTLREQLLEQLLEQQQASLQLETAIQAELAAGTTRIAAQNEQLAALQRELAALTRRVEDNANPVTTSSRDLLFAEAEGLLRLARERLLAARDVAGAVRLYLAADELMQQLDDGAAFSVREVLARELGTLRALPEVDVQGLYTRLAALAARIDGFRVQSDATADFSVDAAATNPPAEDSWYTGISAALDRYFVVSRQDGPVQPLLGNEQQFLIRRGIQLQLEQARLALLRGQTQIWQTALSEAEAGSARWLADEGNSNLAQLLAELRELQATAIITDIPALDNTLRVLQQVLQSATGTTP